MNKRETESFSSKLGVIAAAAGCAVGLGNIWKFPYMAGSNGGAAFIIVYLIIVSIIGYPLLTAEFAVGRKSRTNPIDAFKAKGKKYSAMGIPGVLGSFILLAIYTGIAGWALYYAIISLTGGLNQITTVNASDFFINFITSKSTIIPQLVFIVANLVIVLRGIQGGIEKFSKFAMPLLLGVLIVLVIRSLTLTGSQTGIRFFLKPDWSQIYNINVWSAALVQALFSIGIGLGAMLTYGIYIDKQEDLQSISRQVIFADTFVAILAGFAVFPAVFAFNQNPGAGPGLVFITLPLVFNSMPFGAFFSFLFFILLVFAALTSSISMFEVLITTITNKTKIRRKAATGIIGAIVVIIGISASLSVGGHILSDLGFISNGRSLFDFIDWSLDYAILPISTLLLSIFIGWILKPRAIIDEIESGGIKYKFTKTSIFLLRYVIPMIIAYILFIRITTF
ncbi:sodium-dependent transporter [Mycoplasmatota bacterium]|nr:sodium-dependent transporter [Mycoplasmatota bacterium]